MPQPQHHVGILGGVFCGLGDIHRLGNRVEARFLPTLVTSL